MLILHKIICCDPSSDPSRRDGSHEGSQHMVSIRNKKNNFIKYSLLPTALCKRNTLLSYYKQMKFVPLEYTALEIVVVVLLLLVRPR